MDPLQLMNMERIGKILPGVLATRGMKEPLHASIVVHTTNAWIARTIPEMANDIHAHALGMDGVLLLECKTSVAAQECRYHIADLAAFLRDEGYGTIRSIRVLRERRKRNLSLAPHPSVP